MLCTMTSIYSLSKSGMFQSMYPYILPSWLFRKQDLKRSRYWDFFILQSWREWTWWRIRHDESTRLSLPETGEKARDGHTFFSFHYSYCWPVRNLKGIPPCLFIHFCIDLFIYSFKLCCVKYKVLRNPKWPLSLLFMVNLMFYLKDWISTLYSH